MTVQSCEIWSYTSRDYWQTLTHRSTWWAGGDAGHAQDAASSLVLRWRCAVQVPIGSESSNDWRCSVCAGPWEVVMRCPHFSDTLGSSSSFNAGLCWRAWLESVSACLRCRVYIGLWKAVVEHGNMLLSAVLGLIVPGLGLGCLWRHHEPPARRRIALLVPGMIDCTCARWRLREIGDDVGILFGEWILGSGASCDLLGTYICEYAAQAAVKLYLLACPDLT